jgi:hypothetical protein
MQLIKLHDDFYRIEDAFDKATIKKLRKYFKHRDCWQRLGSIYQSYRITEEPSPIW